MPLLIDKEDVESYLGVSINDALDEWLDNLIEACSDHIENITGRNFDGDDVDTTRYYNGDDSSKMFIHDLMELTSLTLDDEVLTVNSDFYLYPLNAEEDGVPYEWIEIAQPITRTPSNPRAGMRTGTFTEGQRNLAITGKHGYCLLADVPKAIKFAVMKLVGGVIKENIGDTDLKEITQETIGQYSASFAKISEVANAIGVDTLVAGYVRTNKGAAGGRILVS